MIRARTAGIRLLTVVTLGALALVAPATAASAAPATVGVNDEVVVRGHNGGTYQVSYGGGCADCYLTTSISYKSKNDMGIRITSPTGEVRDFNTRPANQQFDYAYWAPVLQAGVWSFEAFGSPGTRVTFTIRVRDGSA